MNDFFMISYAMIMSLIFEAFVVDGGVSLLNVLLFINIMGLYFISQKVNVDIRITYNTELV
jgi:hypothetical protein